MFAHSRPGKGDANQQQHWGQSMTSKIVSYCEQIVPPPLTPILAMHLDVCKVRPNHDKTKLLNSGSKYHLEIVLKYWMNFKAVTPTRNYHPRTWPHPFWIHHLTHSQRNRWHSGLLFNANTEFSASSTHAVQMKYKSFVKKTKAETTFLKGCEESEMFCKAGLHIWDFFSSGTNEWNDDKQVIAQLPVKMTETLSHLVDERIT